MLAALSDSVMSEESTLDRKAWDKAVRGAPDLPTLRDALGELQGAVRDNRLSQHFARTPLLVKGAWMETGGFSVDHVRIEPKYAAQRPSSLPGSWP